MYMYILQLLILMLIIKILNVVSYINRKWIIYCNCALKLPKDKCICSTKFIDLEAKED